MSNNASNRQTEQENEVILNSMSRLNITPTPEKIAEKRKELDTVETTLEFEDKIYLIPNWAYELPKIVQLPDGRQVETGGWFERTPPHAIGTLVSSRTPETDLYHAIEQQRSE